MEAEKEFERIKSKYKPLIELCNDDVEIIKDIHFLINTLDIMNKNAKINKTKFNSLYGNMVTNSDSIFDKYNPKAKIKNLIKSLEKQQEENRKELDKGIKYLSDNMVEAAKNKISINMSIREYLQELLEERN